MVAPLIKQYVHNADPNLLENLTTNFCFIDQDGNKVVGYDNHVIIIIITILIMKDNSIRSHQRFVP
jgi:hypothetical protein